MDSQNENKYVALKESFIKDYFYHKGSQIAILENKALKQVPNNVIVFAKMHETSNGALLEPLTDEEYQNAYTKYKALTEMINKEEK